MERPSRGPSFVAALALALLLETLTLSIVFDLKPLTTHPGLAGVLGAGGGLVPLLFVVPLVLVTLRDPALNALAKGLMAAPVSPRRAVLAAAAHVALFCGFGLGTQALLQSAAPSDGVVVAWLLGAVAVAVVPLLISRPEVRAGPLARRALPALGLGVVLGGGVWGLGTISSRLWTELAPGVLIPVDTILQAILPNVIFEPEHRIIGTESFLVEVAPICSGMEGVGLLTSLAAIVVFVDRARWPWPRAVGLLVCAAALGWVANIVRITGLILVGAAGFEDLAVGGFHSKAGWLLYSALGLVLLSRVRSDSASEPRRGPPAADVFVLPFTVVVAVGLVTGLFSSSRFDPLYGVSALAGGLVLLFARRAARRRGVRLQDPERAGSRRFAIALGGLAYLVWWPLAPPPVTPEIVEGLGALSGLAAGLWVLVRIAGGVIVTPWVEELAFRGYLERRIRSREWTEVAFGDPRLLSAAIAAVVFGALHSAFVPATIAGLLYALAQARGGGVRHAVWAHVTTNALVAAQALFGAL